MAGGEIITISVYNKTGSTLLFTEEIDRPTITIGELLEYPNFVNNNITEISNTIGGQPLNHNDNPSYYTYYDVSPEPETVTGFYLDGTEYKFGGGGSGGISNDTTGTTSTVTKIRAGSEAEFNTLSSRPATTVYIVF